MGGIVKTARHRKKLCRSEADFSQPVAIAYERMCWRPLTRFPGHDDQRRTRGTRRADRSGPFFAGDAGLL